MKKLLFIFLLLTLIACKVPKTSPSQPVTSTATSSSQIPPEAPGSAALNSAASTATASEPNTYEASTAARTNSATAKVAIRTELSNPPALGEAKFLVYVLEDNQAVSGAEVNLQGDMTHAGMVPVLATAPEVSPGLYRSQGFNFTMAGDWIISTEVKLADGKKHHGELKLNIPTP